MGHRRFELLVVSCQLERGDNELRESPSAASLRSAATKASSRQERKERQEDRERHVLEPSRSSRPLRDA